MAQGPAGFREQRTGFKMTRNIIKIALGVWVVLWVVFTVRPLIKNSYLAQYATLYGRPLDERRAVVYGKDLCEFLEYAKIQIPEGATYAFEGFEEGSVDIVRADYCLYPRLRSEKPQFILAHYKNKFNLKKRP